jgi:hypothetical protein
VQLAVPDHPQRDTIKKVSLKLDIRNELVVDGALGSVRRTWAGRAAPRGADCRRPLRGTCLHGRNTQESGAFGRSRSKEDLRGEPSPELSTTTLPG